MGLRSLALVVLGFVVGAAVILFADGDHDRSSVAATTPVAVQTGTASDGHAHDGSAALTVADDTPVSRRASPTRKAPARAATATAARRSGS